MFVPAALSRLHRLKRQPGHSSSPFGRISVAGRRWVALIGFLLGLACSAANAQVSVAGANTGGGSFNLQNAFILGVQTGFTEMVTYGNLDANYLIQQVLPTMPRYAAALGLPQHQLNAMIGQLRSGGASGDAYPAVETVYAQFNPPLNRTCTCGNVYNLAKMYGAGQQIGWAEMIAFLSDHQKVLPDLAGVLTNARQAAAGVALPTNGVDNVLARLKSGGKGCDVAADLQKIEKQFEQLTNRPCTCMREGNYTASNTGRTGPGPSSGPGQPATATPPSTTTGGRLTGSANGSTTEVNLTATGPLDWVHWGGTAYNNYTEITRKAGVTPLISDYQYQGSYVDHYAQDARPLSWTDGTPLQSSLKDSGGRLTGSSGGPAGFTITVPADTTPRTLNLYVGGNDSGATLTAHLSDGSAPDYTDTTGPVQGSYDRNYTITYAAHAAEQSLTVTWRMPSGRSVNLSGAALTNAGTVP